MTDWSKIEERFTRLRAFVLNDLGKLAASEEGGNFGLLVLILNACDALGFRIYDQGGGEKVFARCLPHPWSSEPVATILYDALRNGLTHGYDAKLVQDAEAPLSFAIGWKPENAEKHMKLDGDRKQLYVHPQTLMAALERVFAEVESDLRADPAFCDKYLKRDQKKSIRKVRATEQVASREAVNNAEAVGSASAYTSTTSSPPVLYSGTFGAGATGTPGARSDADPPAQALPHPKSRQNGH